MPKRKDDKRPAGEPLKRPAKRSPQEVYDYWTEEMMAEAKPIEMERKRPTKGAGKEDDNGERSCS